jgi:hypothetical protein
MWENAPGNQEWRRLYEAAIQLKRQAPWEWMTEADNFGVQDPDTGELSFVSVMGMLGEHFAIALYPGAGAFHQFLRLEEAGNLATPEAVLEIPQVQASFEDRDMLQQRDREIIKSLGLKFRGRNAWPLFRTYSPGFLPWFLDREEARILAYGLEQLLEVAPRFREEPGLLHPAEVGSFLIRTSRRDGSSLVWTDVIRPVPPPEDAAIPVVIDPGALESLKDVPIKAFSLEIDVFMVPSEVREKGARPYFPYMLLMVEAGSGFAMGFELLKAHPSLQDMWGRVPDHVVQKLAGLGTMPAEVRVSSPLLFQVLQPVTGQLGLNITQTDHLPALDFAREELLQVI